MPRDRRPRPPPTSSTADLSPYSGPLVTNERPPDHDDVRRAPRAARTSLDDFWFAHQQARGMFDFLLDRELRDRAPAACSTGTPAAAASSCSGSTGSYAANEGERFQRSGARVDGHNAFVSVVVDPRHRRRLGERHRRRPRGCSAPDLQRQRAAPRARTSPSTRPRTWCAATAATRGRSPGAACGRFVPSGVRVERRIRTTRDGTLAVLHRRLPQHRRARAPAGPALDRGLQGPTTPASSSRGTATPTRRTPRARPSAGAPAGSAIFVRTKNTAADGDRQCPQGALVFDAALGQHPVRPPAEFVARRALTVPAEGAVTLRQAYAMATTRAELVEIMPPSRTSTGRRPGEITDRRGGRDAHRAAGHGDRYGARQRGHRRAHGQRARPCRSPRTAAWSAQVTLAPGGEHHRRTRPRRRRQRGHRDAHGHVHGARARVRRCRCPTHCAAVLAGVGADEPDVRRRGGRDGRRSRREARDAGALLAQRGRDGHVRDRPRPTRAGARAGAAASRRGVYARARAARATSAPARTISRTSARRAPPRCASPAASAGARCGGAATAWRSSRRTPPATARDPGA